MSDTLRETSRSIGKTDIWSLLSWLPATSPVEFVVFAIIYNLWFLLHPVMQLNHDCAMYLHAAKGVLRGYLPYILDTNPPLILYLNYIPILISDFLSINPIIIFKLLIFLISLWSANRMRKSLAIENKDFHLRTGTVVAAVFLFSTPFYKYDFGQREHFFVLVSFPYLFLRWLRWEEKVKIGWLGSFSIGIICCLGAFLKPHFLVILWAPEFYWFFVHKKQYPFRAPEILAQFVFGALYVGHFLLLPKEYVHSFFSTIIPLWSMNSGPFDIGTLRQILFTLLPVLVSIIALHHFAVSTRKYRTSSKHHLVMAFWVFLAASTWAYIAQRKCWDYQEIPLWSSLFICFTLAMDLPLSFWKDIFSSLSSFCPTWNRLLRTIHVTTVIALLIGGLTFEVKNYAQDFYLWFTKPNRFRDADFVSYIESRSRSDQPVLMISVDVLGYPGLLHADRPPASRYLWSFPIPFFYQNVKTQRNTPFPYHSLTNASQAEIEFLTQLSIDILVHRPKLILVRRSECTVCPVGFNLYDYVTQNEMLKEILKDYNAFEKVGEYSIADLKVKTDGG